MIPDASYKRMRWDGMRGEEEKTSRKNRENRHSAQTELLKGYFTWVFLLSCLVKWELQSKVFLKLWHTAIQ